ncbi:trypsin-like peptidase domain-containing protein [Methylotenera sp. L2L1]|uniref:trypsin-like peptidase domain-containing protein n=1 Tax=Methylotenera sp. L2L1 TaxID=1502770 RepID=UPI0005688037|nr:trypsin-like peptidase domain-containing protein [Methylotenera sp. L2L1]
MRRFVLLVVLMSLTHTASALDQAKVLKSLQSVVMIRGYNSSGGLAYGSGVVVAENKVITNCHIFRSTKAPWVTRGEDTYEIDSVQADRWHDLCLVTAKLPFTPAPIGSSANIKRGQEVLSIGHSNGVLAPITSSGVIKTTYDFDGGKVIRSSAKFLMGASGSGIFDTEGTLLGINTFKTPGRPAYFYSLPIEWLANLQKLPVETTFPITGKAFWEEDDNNKPFFMQMAIPEINQDWPKLMQVATKWTETYPKDTEAWYELGVAQEKLNKLDDAKKSYLQSVAIDPTNTNALFRLGAIAQSTGDQVSMSKINSTIAKIDENLAKEFSEMLGCNIHC